MKFDHTRKYYCVIEGKSDSKILEEIKKGTGLINVGEPLIHFDCLTHIGKLLYLGDSVRELKIPEDAEIIRDEKGVYPFSADKAELLEIFGCEDIINKIKELEDTSELNLNLSNHEFTGNFVFPEKLDSLTLTRCHLPSMMKLPEKVNSYHSDACTFNSFKVVPPGSIREIFINKADICNCDFKSVNGGHVSVSNSSLCEMIFSGMAESINISESDLKNVHFAEGTESVVISNSKIRELHFPDEIEYLFFINSEIGENIKLPKKAGTFRVLGCTFTSEKVKEKLDELRSVSEW